MPIYQDFSPEEIAAFIHASQRNFNPNFLSNPWARNLAWILFFLRAVLSGKVSFKEFLVVVFGGKRDGAHKEKIKTLSEQEAVAVFNGNVPRLAVGGTTLAPHNVSLASIIELLTLIQEIFIEDQYHAREFLKPDSIVIDAGANIGTFTVLAASIAKRGKVYAFEPAASTRETIVKNTNGAENIVVVPCALGEKGGTAEMLVHTVSPGMSMLSDAGLTVQKGMRGVVAEKIEVVALDDFVAQNGLTKVDFIKMDTEGYEKQIIRGARETIRRFKPVIAASAYHFARDKEDIPKLIRDIEPGYQYQLSKRFEEDLIFWFPK
jgi:FkbM family methyltransferase